MPPRKRTDVPNSTRVTRRTGNTQNDSAPIPPAPAPSTSRRSRGGRQAPRQRGVNLPPPDSPSPPPPSPTLSESTLPLNDRGSDEDGVNPQEDPNPARSHRIRAPNKLSHRLTLEGRPIKDCAADNRHWADSTSLCFTFLVVKALKENRDACKDGAATYTRQNRKKKKKGRGNEWVGTVR